MTSNDDSKKLHQPTSLTIVSRILYHLSILNTFYMASYRCAKNLFFLSSLSRISFYLIFCSGSVYLHIIATSSLVFSGCFLTRPLCYQTTTSSGAKLHVFPNISLFVSISLKLVSVSKRMLVESGFFCSSKDSFTSLQHYLNGIHNRIVLHTNIILGSINFCSFDNENSLPISTLSTSYKSPRHFAPQRLLPS